MYYIHLERLNPICRQQISTDYLKYTLLFHVRLLKNGRVCAGDRLAFLRATIPLRRWSTQPWHELEKRGAAGTAASLLANLYAFQN